MNHVYRLVFNSSRGLTQVTSELGSAEGKHTRRSSGKHAKSEAGNKPTRTPIAAALVLALGITVPMLCMAPAHALTSATGLSGGNGGNGTGSTGGGGGTGRDPSTSNAGGNGGFNSPGSGAYSPRDGYGSGGLGGNGYAHGAALGGGGGGGGGGGAPATVLQTSAYVVSNYQLGSSGSLIGGDGGTGGKGYLSAGGYLAYGGNGGYGAAGVAYGNESLLTSLYSTSTGTTLASYGKIRGGAGGAGNNGYEGGVGGRGGPGFYHNYGGKGSFYITNGSPSNTSAAIYGGAGGAGGSGTSVGGRGGDGGAGGFTGASGGFTGVTYLTNYGTVYGGNGGAGGASPSGTAGTGGAGGAGVTGDAVFVNNESSGSIYGGNGGAGGGAGGVGIYCTGSSIITDGGTIGGGLGNAGSGTRADAIFFWNNGNTLKLLAGYKMVGNVVDQGLDTLVLEGSANGVMAGTFATSAPSTWSGTPVFSGFGTLRKSGTGTWTVNTTTGGAYNAIQNWSVTGGILQLAAGDNFNPSTADKLTVSIKPTSSTTATAGVDNGELDVPGVANLNSEALTIKDASGTYVDGVQYDLVHANGGVNGTFSTVTYSPSLPSNTTGSISKTSNDVYLTLKVSSGTSSGGGSSGGGTSSGGGSTSGGGGGAFGLLSLFGLLGGAGVGRKAARSEVPGD